MTSFKGTTAEWISVYVLSLIPQYSGHCSPAKCCIDFVAASTSRPVASMAASCNKVQAKQFSSSVVAMHATITVP